MLEIMDFRTYLDHPSKVTQIEEIYEEKEEKRLKLDMNGRREQLIN